MPLARLPLTGALVLAALIRLALPPLIGVALLALTALLSALAAALGVLFVRHMILLCKRRFGIVGVWGTAIANRLPAIERGLGAATGRTPL